MSVAEEPARRGRGRPRSPRVDAAIAAATRELLVEVGYGRTSLELVARRAGVSRASIYRRWPNKAQLVYEVVFTAVGPQTVPDTGAVEEDLAALVRAMSDELSARPAVAAAPGVLADFGADEAFRTTVREGFLAPAVGAVEAVLRKAVERGELAADAPLRTIAEAIGGAVFLRCVVLGEAPDPAGPELLARLVLDGARCRTDG